MDGPVTARLASGPVSWGVDFVDGPANPPWREVLDGIASAGYAGTELGPLGFLPVRSQELTSRGLRLTGGFVFEPLHDPERASRTVGHARRVAAAVAELGGEYLLIIDAVSGVRSRTAGDGERARRLSGPRRDAMAETVAAVAEAARAAGVRPLLHPHAGTYVEFADEIEPLRSICGVCVDTGHFLYAGLDPAEFVAGDPAGVGCIHLKDLDPARLRGDFWCSVSAGAFVPLGRGSVDFAAVLVAAGAAGYEGWLVVEQDRAPGSGDPVADLAASRRFLEELA